MIHSIVEALADEINRFLQSKHGIMEDKVLVSNVMNPDGSLAIQEPDKLVLSVVNIETEKSQSQVGGYKTTSRGTFQKVKAPVNINLTILFSAYFTSENYMEGLKFISSIIAFFQSKSGVFTPKNLPAINGLIERLQADLISLDERDMSNIWGLVGSKYMPSVVYKLKTIPIQHEMPSPDIPMVKSV